MLTEVILSILAGFLAGNMNAISGGGTFITYPFLLLMGNSSIVANTTSTVALWPGILASLPGYKKELVQVKSWIKLFIIPALIGGLIGSFILTHTPEKTFNLIVPLLIITGSLILQFQEQITGFFQRIHLDRRAQRIMFVPLLLVIAIYGAYFGAGIGILLLGCLALVGIKDIYENIALKNSLSLIVNFTAVVYFIAGGFVHWAIVPTLALGAIVGGYTGSHLAHRVNKRTVKTFTVILGFVIAITLLATTVK